MNGYIRTYDITEGERERFNDFGMKADLDTFVVHDQSINQ